MTSFLLNHLNKETFNKEKVKTRLIESKPELELLIQTLACTEIQVILSLEFVAEQLHSIL